MKQNHKEIDNMFNRKDYKKFFIVGDHEISIIEVTKRGLLLRIKDSKSKTKIIVFLKNSIIRKIGKAIYERILSIDNGGMITKTFRNNVKIIYKEIYDGKQYEYQCRHCKIDMTIYGTDLINIDIRYKTKTFQQLSFKLNTVSSYIIN